MQSSFLQDRLLACYQQALGHDLPNKLVALQGLARLLDEELTGRLSGEAGEWLARVVGLTREIDDRVRALAEVGRAVKQPGLVTTIDLEDTWSEVGAEIACQTRDRTLSFARSSPLPSVVLPCRALRRVLIELLRHAVRRSPPGQSLRLTLGVEPAGADVLLLLHDDGPAPTSLALQQAFEPRLDDPHGPELGLFLARLLVEGWGGTIRLSAPSEGGCLVTLEIPRSPNLTNAGM